MSSYEVHVIATVTDALDDNEAKNIVLEALEDVFVDAEIKGVIELGE